MSLWENDNVQFARMLAEISYLDLETRMYKELGESMDLTNDEINEIFDRADDAWNKHKERLRKSNETQDKP